MSFCPFLAGKCLPVRWLQRCERGRGKIAGRAFSSRGTSPRHDAPHCLDYCFLPPKIRIFQRISGQTLRLFRMEVNGSCVPLAFQSGCTLDSAGAPLRRKSFTTETRRTRRFGFYRVFSVISVISLVDLHSYGWAADRRDDFRRLLRNPAAELCARGSGLGPARSND